MFAIDLTWNDIIVAYYHNASTHLWSFPWTAVFREDSDSVTVSIGEESVSADEKTAVFYNLRDNFHRIHDRDIQVEIFAQLLRQISYTAAQWKVVEDPRTFVVIPYGYSSEELSAIETAFEQSNAGLELSGWFNECVATILYFFESEDRLAKLKPDPSGDIFCFINATMTPVRAFLVNYKETGNERIFVVEDYYISPEPFQGYGPKWPDLSIPRLKAVVFGNPLLVNPAGEVVDVVTSVHRCRVMVAGAIILGSGKFRSKKVYVIEGAFGYGIQTDSEKFYQIVPKELMLGGPRMPLTRNKAFTISKFTHDTNLNLYCGFSNKLDGAIKLGTVPLMKSQYPQHKAEVVVSVELDSMHSGKFSVMQIPGHACQTRTFKVPGWLG